VLRRNVTMVGYRFALGEWALSGKMRWPFLITSPSDFYSWCRWSRRGGLHSASSSYFPPGLTHSGVAPSRCVSALTPRLRWPKVSNGVGLSCLAWTSAAYREPYRSNAAQNVRFWHKADFSPAAITVLVLRMSAPDSKGRRACFEWPLPLGDRPRRPIVAGQRCHFDILDHPEAQGWIEITHCLFIEVDNATGL